MSSTVSQEWTVMLAELLLAEKENTRLWLRAEMDGLVDSMFDSIFNRLKTKLTNELEQTQSGDGDCAQVVNNDDQLEPSHSQLDQSSFVIAQPSTSSHLMPQHQNVHYSYQQPNYPIHCNDNSNQQSQLSSLVQPTLSSNPQVNFEALSNEQYNQNFNDEVEDDDDSDSVQCIENEQEDGELPRPVKRSRLESTKHKNAQVEVTGQPTSDAPPKQVNKLIITVHLQCPLSQCPDTFPEDQLTQHMFDAHSMGPSRCLVKECKQAFKVQHFLVKHIKQAHIHTTQWHCDSDRNYPSFSITRLTSTSSLLKNEYSSYTRYL